MLQSCQTLCDPRDGSPPGSAIPRILQAGVACLFLLQRMKVKSESKVSQSCRTLSDPMDCSPPGSSTHGILQAIVLEWGAIAFSGYSDDTALMAESKEELKSLLIKVKEETEKAGLKLHIQKTKIMASSPINHFMANRWGNNGNSDRLYFPELQSHYGR